MMRHLMLSLCAATGLVAADWQWVEDTPGGRALLWVPPTCTQVRGVIIGCQVILEKTALDDPQVRAAATEAGLAMVLIAGGPISQFNYDPQGKRHADVVLDQILGTLAERTGISELAKAPLLPIGHSGEGILVWNLAWWNPSRVIGGIPLHSAPMTAPPAYNAKAKIDGVPMLDITGQWESWGADSFLDRHWEWVRGGLIDMRSRMPEVQVGALVQPGCGHFSWNDRLAGLVARFVRDTAARRLPPTPGNPLSTIPMEAGWLSDTDLRSPHRHPPAPTLTYQGDRSLAFWYPSAELATEIDALSQPLADRKPQMLTFVEQGKPLNPTWCIDLKHLTPEADGITYRVAATFVDAMPTGTRDAGRPLGHATGGEFHYRCAGGNAGGGEQVGPDLMRVRYDQLGIQRNRSILVLASHDGDEQYAFSEIAASIAVADRTNGTPQVITFPELADLRADSAGVDFAATSDAGLPISYAVLRGPVEVHGNRLTITAIPRRATLPLTCTVAAWQRGRDGDAPIRTATPVERTFRIISR